MTLSDGTTLGPYEIVALIGAGGMGEVYLARDTKLDRQVAIKVLPETMTRDPERVARFEREAKLLASLNHPNISAIYGFDESDGMHFLALEYVEGETLAKRLKGGPLAREDALEVAKQMAEALEAAHERGVVHRDLKPGNVMIKPDGSVKILDFGLAKAMSEEPSDSASANSPTITADFTRPGVVLGTAAYMSPEQARGRHLDKRSDIWSFGIILFECLSGKTLFRGETATDSMGAIMHKEPDWTLLPPGTPPTVHLLLRRCLTKDRKRRLHDIADARIELEQAIADPTSSSLNLASAALAEGRPRSLSLTMLILTILVAGVAGAAGWLLKPAPSSPRVARLTVSIPEEHSLAGWPYPVLSPDGRLMAFVAEGDTGREQIILRELDQSDFRVLDGTEGSWLPFFSPDGEWIAYGQGDKLRKLSIHGGPSIALCDAPAYRGGVWTSNGTIVFAANNFGGLSEVSAAGGTPVPFTQLPESKRTQSHRHPHALPGGRGILFTEANDGADWKNSTIWVVAGKDDKPRQLIPGASDGQYVATGHLVYLREGTLLAAPFDLDELKVTGESFPVLEGVTNMGGGRPAQFSLDNQGTLLYMSGTANPKRQLVLVDQTGNETPVSERTGDFGQAVFSPDDSMIAVEISTDTEMRIGVLERGRDILRMFPTGATTDRDPAWSPDGVWIAFASQIENTTWNIYRMRADFTGKPERLTVSETWQAAGDWSPDGTMLAYLHWQPETNGDIHILHFDESGNVTADPDVLIDEPNWQWSPRFSPDGQWISYTSTESGRPEICVHPTRGKGSAIQISTGGGFFSMWSPTERRIFYVDRRANPITMYSVAYTVEDSMFRAALPEPMFEFDEGTGRLPGAPDISHDGKYFLITKLVAEKGESARREPTIILNWAEELKARIPTQAGL